MEGGVAAGGQSRKLRSHLQPHTEKVSREWARPWPLNAHPQWPTFSSKPHCPKIFIAHQERHQLGTRFNCMSLRGTTKSNHHTQFAAIRNNRPPNYRMTTYSLLKKCFSACKSFSGIFLHFLFFIIANILTWYKKWVLRGFCYFVCFCSAEVGPLGFCMLGKCLAWELHC